MYLVGGVPGQGGTWSGGGGCLVWGGVPGLGGAWCGGIWLGVYLVLGDLVRGCTWSGGVPDLGGVYLVQGVLGLGEYLVWGGVPGVGGVHSPL